MADVKKLGMAILEGYDLRFHKISKLDGSAKCDAMETGDPAHKVFGILFEITESGKLILDRIEGLGHGYNDKNVRVELDNGKSVNAITYYATSIDPELKPFIWYKEHILRGAVENGLPQSYIQKIMDVEAIADPDRLRDAKEMSIYKL